MFEKTEKEAGNGPFKKLNQKRVRFRKFKSVCLPFFRPMRSVWLIKSRQMSTKVAQKLFHYKIKDFDIFTKIA